MKFSFIWEPWPNVCFDLGIRYDEGKDRAGHPQRDPDLHRSWEAFFLLFRYQETEIHPSYALFIIIFFYLFRKSIFFLFIYRIFHIEF